MTVGFLANYLQNLCRVKLGAEPERPLMFSYYITHRCELNCRYCSDGDGRRFKEDPTAELDTATSKRLLEVLRPSCDTLDMTGGEPLLRDDLEEILSHAKSLGFRTILNTKGVGLAKRPDLLKNVSVLVLSLDTLDPERLAALIGRPLATARRILASLDYAREACRSTDTRLVLSAVATPENLEEVARVLDFALECGLGFHISPEIAGTRVNPLLRNNKAYRALVDRIRLRKHSKRGVLGVPEYLIGIRDFGEFRCHPLLMPTIRPDGRLYYPCLEWKQAEVDLLAAGSFPAALRAARQKFGPLPSCPDCCHIFCHMALSLLQSHPLSALGELKHWRNR